MRPGPSTVSHSPRPRLPPVSRPRSAPRPTTTSISPRDSSLLTVAPAVVVPPFPSEVWEADQRASRRSGRRGGRASRRRCRAGRRRADRRRPSRSPTAEPIADGRAGRAPTVASRSPPPPETEPDGTTVADLAAAAIVADAVTPDQKAAKQTSGLLRRFRPGQDLNAELDAYERERSAALPAAATVASRGSRCRRGARGRGTS